MISRVLTASAVVILTASFQAQGLRFDVASIRRNQSDSTISGTRLQPDGSYIATNVTLSALIMSANGLSAVTERYRLVGGPGWIDSERFDVRAKGPERLSRSDVPPMLQRLLEERFHLVVRRETREAPMFELVRARRDGRLGSELMRSTLDCSSSDKPVLTLGPGAGDSSPADGTARCGLVSTHDGRGGLINAGRRPISDLASALQALLKTPVVDRTGLAGAYDFRLRWTPDNLANLPRDPSTTSSPLNDGTSMFAALEDQLGLKLERQRGPLEHVVIEHVEPLIPD